jgi:hypothetical protein
MRLVQRQIEMLRRSARRPGRFPAELAGKPTNDDEPADPDNVVRAIADARWAMEHADTGAPSRRAEQPPGADAAAAAPVMDWQPIATAPPQRDVEVRVRDPIGPYSLLYPCRLVVGTGWINALAKHPLTVEPVEWRDWLEVFPDFR